jgi:hypothetical protein
MKERSGPDLFNAIYQNLPWQSEANHKKYQQVKPAFRLGFEPKSFQMQIQGATATRALPITNRVWRSHALSALS